ncbi:MAG: type II CAAX endopeptidase family protein [Pseudomonadota bacterium]
MTYPGFDPFVGPAAQRSELWRAGAGAALVLILYTIGAVGIIAGVGALFSEQVGPFDIATGATPIAVLILLFHFVAMVVAVVLVTRFLHKRSGWTLLGDRSRLVGDFLRMLGLALIVSAIASTLAVLILDLSPNVPLGTWLIFLPLALPMILLQTGAEELVFRGYLLQQLGARFGVAARAAWMVLPSLLFAVLHVDMTSQGSNVWAVLAVITLFALITADVTARTGSLGAAWGLHFMNNVQAILIFSLDGPLSGLSLATVGLEANTPAALPLFAADGVALLVIYALWRRRYG